MSALLISGGRVIDPANSFDAVADVLLRDGRVAAVGEEAARLAEKEPGATPETPCERLDARGRIVCPGLIGLPAHLRKPGQSAKETIATGTRAAARGGFTTIVCMPNTSPSIDNPAAVGLVKEKAEREGVVNVFVAGAITKEIGRASC